MNLRYLKTFLAIVEEGSFSAAAEVLNYTQSTITFQIGQLEEELNVQLFEKVGRKMVLTSAGEALVPYATEVMDSVNRLRHFQGDLMEFDGELHIGVAETFLNYKLPPALKEIVANAPKAKLVLESMNCYEIRNALANGELDLGIFYQDVGGYMDSLTLIPLQSYEVGMVASPKIAADFPDFLTENQQYPIPFIINEKNCIFRQIFENYLQERKICLSHTIEMSSISTIKELAKNDVGVTFLPRFAMEEELTEGSLQEIATDVEHKEITIAIGYHKNKWISPLMQNVIDCVLNLDL